MIGLTPVENDTVKQLLRRILSGVEEKKRLGIKGKVCVI